MTNIVVLIKQVPDTWSERKLSEGDFTLDREAADSVARLILGGGDAISEVSVNTPLASERRRGDEQDG